MIEVMDITVSRDPYKDASLLLKEVENLTHLSHEEKTNWLSRMVLSLMIDAMKETGTWKGIGWYAYNLYAQLGSKYKLKNDVSHIRQ